ncbi:MAG TPA: hypothetical protein VHY22_17060 [Chthoniobacteraceae bacterium]|jgi:hypothetical protein|nr:hypothetical protein [Chthoniobacteraceae bacterium]
MPTNDSRTLTRITKSAVVHKVIDITPEPASASRKIPAAQMFASLLKHRVAVIAAGAAVLAGSVFTLAMPHAAHKAVAAAAPVHPAPAAIVAPVISQKNPPAPQKPVLVELNLPTAVQQGYVDCQWRGNGRERLVMDARNTGNQPLRLHLGAGQLLASDDCTIVVLKSQTLDFAPHAVLHEEFATAATSSANKVIGAEYHLSAGALPDLGKLFTYLAAHPANEAAIQTATLILTENLPLSAFAKFNELSAGPATVRESQDFKADTSDILTALMIIKNIGIDRPLAVTIDPQLEVEAMIDPDAHGLALSYYGIADEWGYWKNQLLQGDPSTRHYALYGIARYYPDIALQMLPKWARQDNVSPVYRMSAVEALAETDRAGAIPILRELEREFGGTTDLGHAAHQAANYLDEEFSRTAKLTASNQTRPGSLASVGN